MLDAMLALFREGVLEPTAQEIADRAGLSLRSVHHHFDDREALFIEVARRQLDWMKPLLGDLELDVTACSFPTRLEAFVHARCSMLERMTPTRRAVLLMIPSSPTARRGVAGLRRLKREQVQRIFAPELDGCLAHSEPLAAAAAVTSWSHWEELRGYQGLSIARAQRTVRASVECILRP